MLQIIKSPRLKWGESLERWQMKDEPYQVPLESKDPFFGMLCYLEFGNLDFASLLGFQLENESVLVQTSKDKDTFVKVNRVFDKTIEEIHNFKICRIVPYDSKKEKYFILDDWDPRIYFILHVEFLDGSVDVFDLYIANDLKINKILQKYFENFYKKSKDYFDFQSKFLEDTYTCKNHKNLFEKLEFDFFQTKKTEKTESVFNKRKKIEQQENYPQMHSLQLQSPQLQSPQLQSPQLQSQSSQLQSPQISDLNNLNNITTSTPKYTTFSFLGGKTGIVYETSPPMLYKKSHR
jgi:hypothetical protein